MAVDEQARYELYEAHKRQFGAEVATTLMELLPPVGWADVATKHDLLALEQRMDLRFEALESRMDAKIERLDAKVDRLQDRIEGKMQARLRRQTIQLVGILVPSMVATVVAVFASTHVG